MSKLKFLILSFVFLFLSSFYSCQKEKHSPNKAEVISKLQSSAKLSTVEYVVTKVISAEKKKLLSNKYFFAETKAFIKAGIDLNKLQDGDVIIEGRKINLTLPAVEILEFSYPPTAFNVVEKYTGTNGPLDFNTISLEERDKLYRAGETDIKNSIKHLGIKQTAEKNTQLFFRNILINAGFDEIYIKFKSQNKIEEESSKESNS